MEEQKKSKVNIKNRDTCRLNDLPDNVLLHIMTFMNTKHSVQTCVLSQRWKNLWKSLTNLTLQHYYHPSRSGIFNKFVFEIMSRRDDSLPLYSLKYVHIDLVDCPKTTLVEVMKYALSHNVQQLEVIARISHIKNLELPPSIFYCRSLTFLRIEFSFAYSDNFKKTRFPKSFNLPALKTLHLVGLTFTTSDNGCAEPFSTCNMLSTLIVKDCSLQGDGQTLCISNSNVSSLTIHVNIMYPNYKLVLCTPKLTSLAITGHPTFLVVSSACSLHIREEANIYYNFFYEPYDDLLLISWLQLLANVKIMTLDFFTLKVIFKVRTQPPCFVRLKLLKVKLGSDSTISNERVREMAICLLQNSPHARVDIIRKASLTLSHA